MFTRKIVHVDMDCFFAAIEMRDDPSLTNIPVAIGGSVENRGVICTANYPARRYGVHSAMSTARAMKLCPGLKVLPVRMGTYEAVSSQIQDIFTRFTSRIEPVSLDEAYLDVTDCEAFRGSATLIAQEIRASILRELGLTSSAGIAPVKFLAKIASDINKPNGQFVITPDQVKSFLQSLSLRKIPGVGPKTSKRLSDLGLNTCADVQQINISVLIKNFGKMGVEIWERCHGIDESSVCFDSVRRTVGVEVTLPQDINCWQQYQEVVRELFPELMQRLNVFSPDLSISRQGVKVKFDDFQVTTHEFSCQTLTLAGQLSAAKFVWESRRNGRGIRLIGLNVALPDPFFKRQLTLKW
jgi:DNA polymerase-4